MAWVGLRPALLVGRGGMLLLSGIVLCCPMLAAAQSGGSSSSSILLWGLVGGVLGLLVLFSVALLLLCWVLKRSDKRHQRQRHKRGLSKSSQSGLLADSRGRNTSAASCMTTEADDGGASCRLGLPSATTTMTSIESGLSMLSLNDGSEVLLQRAHIQPPPAPNIVLTFKQSPATVLRNSLQATSSEDQTESSDVKYGVNKDPSAFGPQLAKAIAIADADRASSDMELIWPSHMPPLMETSREGSRISTLQKSSDGGSGTVLKSTASTLARTEIREGETLVVDMHSHLSTSTSTGVDGYVQQAAMANDVTPAQDNTSTSTPLDGANDDVIVATAGSDGGSVDDVMMTSNGDGGDNHDALVSADQAAVDQLEELQRALTDELEKPDENGRKFSVASSASGDRDCILRDDDITIPASDGAMNGDSTNDTLESQWGDVCRDDAMEMIASPNRIVPHTMESKLSEMTMHNEADIEITVTGASFGLDVMLWGAADETSDNTRQEDVWDAIHGFYDQSASGALASTMLSDRSNVDEDLEQLNMSLDTLAALRKLESKERKAAKNMNRKSQPIVHVHDVPSVMDIFPDSGNTSTNTTTTRQAGEDSITGSGQTSYASTMNSGATRTAESASEANSQDSSLVRIVDNAEKDFLEAPVFRQPIIEEEQDTSDSHVAAQSNSLFVNPMYLPAAQT